MRSASRNAISGGLALVFFAIVPTMSAWADSNHYVNLLVGDRASGMGGAYTAVADDPAGLFYNPAGVVYAGSTSLSASMNAYRSSSTTYQGVIGGKDWNRDSSVLIPNFFGIVQPLGRGAFGISYAVPDSVRTDQDQVFRALPAPLDNIERWRINFNESDTTYNFGPSLAYPVGERASLGLTLYGHIRQSELIVNILSQVDDGTSFSSSSYVETDEYGVRPVLGALVELGDRLALGMRLSKTHVFSSDSRVQNTRKSFGEETVTEVVEDVDDRRRYPWSGALGLAWFASDAFLLSSDLSYSFAITDRTFGDREATWNAALGAEWFVSPTWALRGGVFTDRANTRDVEDNGRVQKDHVDLYGGALSVSHHSRGSSLTLGTIYQTGSGEAQLLSGAPEPQDAETANLTIFLSASYRN